MKNKDKNTSIELFNQQQPFLVLEETLWKFFCLQAEELGTTPSSMMLRLMERFLITTGKLKEDWRLKDNKAITPVSITLAELKDKELDHFGMGKNNLLKKKRLKEDDISLGDDDDEDEGDNIFKNLKL